MKSGRQKTASSFWPSFSRSFIIPGLAFASAMFAAPRAGLAQIVHWTNSGGGFWDVGSNWTEGVAPGPEDVAEFSIGGSYGVLWDDLTGDTQTNSLNVTNGHVYFRNTGNSGRTHTTTGFVRALGTGTILDLGTNPGSWWLDFQSNEVSVYYNAELRVSGSSQLRTTSFYASSGGSTTVSAEGLLQSDEGWIGATTSSALSVVNVLGLNSTWNSGALYVGADGNGQLSVSGGGRVNSSIASIGTHSEGSVQVGGSNSLWNVASELRVGEGGIGGLDIFEEGSVYANSVTIGHYQDSLGDVNVAGANARMVVVGGMIVGNYGYGTLDISSGGKVDARSVIVANNGGGSLSVTGPGSEMEFDEYLRVGGFDNGPGTVTIEGGGKVRSVEGVVGLLGGDATATVAGSGSEWLNTGLLLVGGWGQSTLSIEQGGRVTSLTGVIDGFSGNPGGERTVNVGSNSVWETSGVLRIGAESSGTLNIAGSGALVQVGGTTTIGSGGVVNVSGGRFEFGETGIADYGRINRNAGSLAGTVHASGVNSVGLLNGGAADVSEVIVRNAGLLHGSALTGVALDNLAAGELRTTASDWVRFGGTGNSSAGRINNFGGVVEFGGTMANAAAGLVAGRGVFVAGGGWTNSGNFAVSGATDIVGDFDNLETGKYVTSANATSTFHDDVVNNGEIRTSLNGNTVFFGDLSGSGSFTGTGNVFVEGDMNPGNSPGVSYFGGNLFLGSGSDTLFELGGQGFGEFDKLVIAGNLNILGDMSVALWNGFQLGDNMQFLVAEVGGTRTGLFTGFGEGSLVGNFGGQDLFITYGGGDGNDIELFTAIPEPSGLTVAGLALLCGVILRRKRST